MMPIPLLRLLQLVHLVMAGVWCTSSALAQGAAAPTAGDDAQPAVVDTAPKVATADAPITTVTVYPGRAAVTRSTTLSLDQGVHAIRFENLPAAIQPDTLQSKVGDAARLVNVEYLETPVAEVEGSPAFVELERKIEDAERALERLREDAALLEAQRKLVEQIGVRSAADATRDAGTERLDLDSLRRQLEFVQKERLRLVQAVREFQEKIRTSERELGVLVQRRDAMGESDRVARNAEVTIAVPRAGEVPISITYLVENAGWEAVYNVRAANDRSAVTLEFDANLLQRSGEDWNDVELVISTAQPTVRANPPSITPVFVNVHVPVNDAVTAGAPAAPPASKVAPGRPGGGGFGGGGGTGGGGGGGFPIGDAAPMDPEELRKEQMARELDAWSSGASIVEGGTAVSYELPRRVTVPTDSDRKTRTRVATIAPTAAFVYTAAPLLTDAVYLRGRMVNDSPFQLVPGPAQVFMGTEYVGPTRLEGVAPKGEFTVYFGIDRSIRAKRTLVSRTTSESGVFSKSTEVTRAFRITIDNGSGRAIELELMDRRPVSRDERVTVATESLSTPLSTNAEYVRDQLPQGIMRWDLSIPANATGPNAQTITWTTRVSAPRDLILSHVPD